MNLKQFKDWAVSQGQVGNPNPGNTYLGQCVSLIQQYINKVYGIAWTPRGNAIDWPSNADVLSNFDKVSSPRAGDIGVMGANFGEGYGHIFIYLTPTTILEQNGRVPLHVSTGSAYANPIAILRHKGGETDMITDGEKDKVLKMGLHREPLPEELNNPAYNDASTVINTVWNNGGEANYLAEKADKQKIDDLQKQLDEANAKASVTSGDTQLLNNFGKALLPLLIRLGLKKE